MLVAAALGCWEQMENEPPPPHESTKVFNCVHPISLLLAQETHDHEPHGFVHNLDGNLTACSGAWEEFNWSAALIRKARHRARTAAHDHDAGSSAVAAAAGCGVEWDGQQQTPACCIAHAHPQANSLFCFAVHVVLSSAPTHPHACPGFTCSAPHVLGYTDITTMSAKRYTFTCHLAAVAHQPIFTAVFTATC